MELFGVNSVNSILILIAFFVFVVMVVRFWLKMIKKHPPVKQIIVHLYKYSIFLETDKEITPKVIQAYAAFVIFLFLIVLNVIFG